MLAILIETFWANSVDVYNVHADNDDAIANVANIEANENQTDIVISCFVIHNLVIIKQTCV